MPPFSGFTDFDDCVESMQSKGHDKTSSKRICGKLQSESKSGSIDEFDPIKNGIEYKDCIEQAKSYGHDDEAAKRICDTVVYDEKDDSGIESDDGTNPDDGGKEQEERQDNLDNPINPRDNWLKTGQDLAHDDMRDLHNQPAGIELDMEVTDFGDGELDIDDLDGGPVEDKPEGSDDEPDIDDDPEEYDIDHLTLNDNSYAGDNDVETMKLGSVGTSGDFSSIDISNTPTTKNGQKKKKKQKDDTEEEVQMNPSMMDSNIKLQNQPTNPGKLDNYLNNEAIDWNSDEEADYNEKSDTKKIDLSYYDDDINKCIDNQVKMGLSEENARDFCSNLANYEGDGAIKSEDENLPVKYENREYVPGTDTGSRTASEYADMEQSQVDRLDIALDILEDIRDEEEDEADEDDESKEASLPNVLINGQEPSEEELKKILDASNRIIRMYESQRKGKDVKGEEFPSDDEEEEEDDKERPKKSAQKVEGEEFPSDDEKEDDKDDKERPKKKKNAAANPKMLSQCVKIKMKKDDKLSKEDAQSECEKAFKDSALDEMIRSGYLINKDNDPLEGGDKDAPEIGEPVSQHGAANHDLGNEGPYFDHFGNHEVDEADTTKPDTYNFEHTPGLQDNDHIKQHMHPSQKSMASQNMEQVREEDDHSSMKGLGMDTAPGNIVNKGLTGPLNNGSEFNYAQNINQDVDIAKPESPSAAPEGASIKKASWVKNGRRNYSAQACIKDFGGDEDAAAICDYIGRVFQGSYDAYIKDMQIKPFEANNKLFVKAFLMDSSVNQNQWGIHPSTLDNNIRTYIGKPLVLQHNFDHPVVADDNLQHQLEYQELFRIGNIVDVVNKGTRYDAIAEITDPYAQKAFKEGMLPLYVSPQLFKKDPTEQDGQMTKWVGTHLAIVKEPAYGVKTATVNGECTGEAEKCLTYLKRAAIIKKYGYGNCGYCNYKVLVSSR